MPAASSVPAKIPPIMMKSAPPPKALAASPDEPQGGGDSAKRDKWELGHVGWGVRVEVEWCGEGSRVNEVVAAESANACEPG